MPGSVPGVEERRSLPPACLPVLSENGVLVLDQGQMCACASTGRNRPETRFAAAPGGVAQRDFTGIAVLRHHLERDLLPSAADQDRDMGVLHPLGLVDRAMDLVIPTGCATRWTFD